jgi:hypothetical protein
MTQISQKIDIFEASHKDLTALKYQVDEIKAKLGSLESNNQSLNPLLSRIEDIKSKIIELEEAQIPLKKHIEEQSHIRPEMPENKAYTALRPAQTMMNVREKLLRKLAKSSKDHVKSLIKNLIIKYGQISALHLREMLVEEQGLCSKSSFYRILEELEADEDLSVMHDKKEKKYTYNAIKLK